MPPQGQPWGALEEARLGKPLAKGLHFPLPVEDSEEHMLIRPWLELLQTGAFSQQTLERLPLSYQTTDPWCSLLRQSYDSGQVDRQSSTRNPVRSCRLTYMQVTWLSSLHLGICAAERGGLDEPRSFFSASMSMLANPIAARCMAVLSKSSSDAWAQVGDLSRHHSHTPVSIHSYR